MNICKAPLAVIIYTQQNRLVKRTIFEQRRDAGEIPSERESYSGLSEEGSSIPTIQQ